MLDAYSFMSSRLSVALQQLVKLVELRSDDDFRAAVPRPSLRCCVCVNGLELASPAGLYLQRAYPVRLSKDAYHTC